MLGWMAHWQHAEGTWHAVDDSVQLEPDQMFRAYCGQWVTTTFEDFRSRPGGICEDCMSVAKEMRC